MSESNKDISQPEPPPVRPPALPPDFPDVSQNPSSVLQPPPDSSADPSEVAGATPALENAQDRENRSHATKPRADAANASELRGL